MKDQKGLVKTMILIFFFIFTHAAIYISKGRSQFTLKTFRLFFHLSKHLQVYSINACIFFRILTTCPKSIEKCKLWALPNMVVRWRSLKMFELPFSPPAHKTFSVSMSCEIFSLHSSLAVFVFKYWSLVLATLFLTNFRTSSLFLLEVRPQPMTRLDF